MFPSVNDLFIENLVSRVTSGVAPEVTRLTSYTDG